MPIEIKPEPWPMPQPDEHGLYPSATYYEAIGRLAVRWNLAEAVLLDVAAAVTRTSRQLCVALLIHVGDTTLKDSLRAASEHRYGDGPIHEELIYLTNLFDRNRQNRNFILHRAGPINGSYSFIDNPALADSSHWETPGQIFIGINAKTGRVKTPVHFLSYPQIRSVVMDIHRLTVCMEKATSSFEWPLDKPAFPQRPQQPEILSSILPRETVYNPLHGASTLRVLPPLAEP
jgi:hypothetical protein